MTGTGRGGSLYPERLVKRFRNEMRPRAASEKLADELLAGQITSLKSKAEGLGIAFYGSIQEPLKEFASVGVKALEDLDNAYTSNGFVGFINEIGNKVPLLQSFTNAIAGLAEKTKSMSTDELMNLGKTAAVLAGAAPAFGILGKSAGHVRCYSEQLRRYKRRRSCEAWQDAGQSEKPWREHEIWGKSIWKCARMQSFFHSRI